MPGVPSNRGCDACRKQKKKVGLHATANLDLTKLKQCDQAQPACSRCARIGIKCVGVGKRRYKFHNQTIVFRSGSTSGRQQLVVSANEAFPATPSNEVMRRASAYISMLEVSDVRYSLSYFGLFLRHVPQRLGRNEALDAAASALATTTVALHTSRRTPEMYASYGKALEALRTSLDDPLKAQTTETLCAIYFVMISQVSTTPRRWNKTEFNIACSVGSDFVMIGQSRMERSWHIL